MPQRQNKQLKQKRRRLRNLADPELERIESILTRDQGYSPYDVMARLKETMWAKAGIIRDSASLAEAFEDVFDLKLMAERIVAKKRTGHARRSRGIHGA